MRMGMRYLTAAFAASQRRKSRALFVVSAVFAAKTAIFLGIGR